MPPTPHLISPLPTLTLPWNGKPVSTNHLPSTPRPVPSSSSSSSSSPSPIGNPSTRTPTPATHRTPATPSSPRPKITKLRNSLSCPGSTSSGTSVNHAERRCVVFPLLFQSRCGVGSKPRVRPDVRKRVWWERDREGSRQWHVVLRVSGVAVFSYASCYYCGCGCERSG